MRASRLDLVVWSLAAFFLIITAVTLIHGDQIGIRILNVRPQNGHAAAGSAPIVLEFTEKMDAASVESHFEIQPSVDGFYTWRNNTLYFVPKQAWDPNTTYKATLHAGASDQLDHALINDYSWSFSVRQPGFVFIRDNDLWAKTDLNGSAFQLTKTNGSLFDFSISEDGEHVLYSRFNEQAGNDLWLVDRNGNNDHLLLNCGADRCFAADFSANGQIAYSRSSAPLTPAEAYGAPRIWLLDPNTLETVRLHADTQKIGYGPSWSADGKKLAYYDGAQSRIVIVDIDTGDELSLPSIAGVIGSWAPDGQQMFYQDIQNSESGSLKIVYRADLATQDILPYFEPLPTDAEFSNPVVSPDGKWLVLKADLFDAGFGDQIWVFPMSEDFATVATDEPDYLISNIGWNPWSDALIFYRIQLGVGSPVPEVWMWSMKTAELTNLENDADAPAWLP